VNVRRTPRALPLTLSAALCAVAGAACLTPGIHTQVAPALEAARDGTGELEMLQVRGAWLRVHKSGPVDTGKTPVVFVHGYGSRLESWRAVQPAVAQARMTVSFDQRGFGKSERPASSDHAGYGAVEHARDLVALLDELGLQRVVIVGHSYGASVALHAALDHPERVAGLVLVSPFVLDSQKNSFLRWASLPGMGEWLYATTFRDFSGEKMLLPFAEPHAYATLAGLDEIERNHALPGTTYAALATVRGMDFDEARYGSIKVPRAIVWGERDRVTPIRRAPDVVAALGDHGGRATLTRVPDVGHMPPWERPAAVLGAIDSVLSQLEGSAP
jgi:3-oxoadipate enol-lactonase